MTSGLKSFDTDGSSRHMIKIFEQIATILEKYRSHYDKRLNFTELIKRLRISLSETDDIISLIIRFQHIFKHVFKGYELKKQRRDGKAYLVAERNYKDDFSRTIDILQSRIKLINDFVYTFKFVMRGKGFDVSQNESELIGNLKQLRNIHPYLFESYGNGAIYPSQLGLKLGEMIISYNKSNKDIKTIQIENYTFNIRKDE